MSLKTWKAEFYQTEAKNCPRSKAAEHSLRKWIGLKKENLKKHKVKVGLIGVIDERYNFLSLNRNTLIIDKNTCALCKHFLSSLSGCEKCPLAIIRGGVPCDENRKDQNTAPFSVFWEKNHNPNSMIYWLRKAVKYQREHKE